jgi:hypothetical protein
MKSLNAFAVFAIAALVACAPPPPARVTAPVPTPIKYVAPEVGLNNSGLDTALAGRLDKIVKTAIEEAVAPGVAIAVGRNGHIAYMKGYGFIDWNQPGSPAAVGEDLLHRDLRLLGRIEFGKVRDDRSADIQLPRFLEDHRQRGRCDHLGE